MDPCNAVSVRRLSLLFAVLPVFALTGCEREPPEEMVQEIEELRAERERLQAQAEQLEVERTTMQELRADLEALELSGEPVTEDDPPLESQRDTIRALVRAAGWSLNETRSQLQSARARAATLDSRVDSLRAVHEEVTIRHEQELAEARERLQTMETRVTELTGQIASFESELEEARATYASLDQEAHRVHYVVGSREELLRRGIVTEEGGARVLFLLWRRGETLVPARNPDPTQFTSIDKREVREIVLPRPGARYRVVSRHDPTHLEAALMEDGTVSGEFLRIADPDRFWEPSPFLILVERES